MSVSARLAQLQAEYRLPDGTAARFEQLLAALAAEDDPHTTISDPAAAVDQHIADSLSALEVEAVREAHSLVDIGAGAGFPGLALAIALPEARVDLVESARRKCAVIERLALAASLTNARALPVRAEEWAASDGRDAYELATARAVAPLAVLDPAEEGAGAAAAEIVGLRPTDVFHVTPFPGAIDLNLHLYLKDRETPDRFPRRPGAAAKRPLA